MADDDDFGGGADFAEEVDIAVDDALLEDSSKDEPLFAPRFLSLLEAEEPFGLLDLLALAHVPRSGVHFDAPSLSYY